MTISWTCVANSKSIELTFHSSVSKIAFSFPLIIAPFWVIFLEKHLHTNITYWPKIHVSSSFQHQLWSNILDHCSVNLWFSKLQRITNVALPPGGQCDWTVDWFRGGRCQTLLEQVLVSWITRSAAEEASVHTHTLRAFRLQTSRAVTPTIMAMRNKPALTPSITPLRGSADQKTSSHQRTSLGFALHPASHSGRVNHAGVNEASEGVWCFVLTSLGDHRQRQERVGEQRRAEGEVASVLIKQLSERSDAEPADRTRGTFHFNITVTHISVRHQQVELLRQSDALNNLSHYIMWHVRSGFLLKLSRSSQDTELNKTWIKSCHFFFAERISSC